MTCRGVPLFFVVALVCGCDETNDERAVERAEFGVFFGGQVQERDDIPFELNPAKQTQGFRIELKDANHPDLPVAWEVTMPDSKGNSRFVTILHDDVIRSGQKSFEQSIRFEPGNALGLWNVRVVLSDQVLIDRPFTVYDPVARARRKRRDAGR